jgi:hypothetical protein
VCVEVSYKSKRVYKLLAYVKFFKQINLTYSCCGPQVHSELSLPFLLDAFHFTPSPTASLLQQPIQIYRVTRSSDAPFAQVNTNCWS